LFTAQEFKNLVGVPLFLQAYMTMDITDENCTDACRQTLIQWYKLWTEWTRGLTERSVLMASWKSIVIDGASSKPFVWIDDSGMMRKDLIFLTDPMDDASGAVTSEDDDEETILLSSQCYGSGATWNGIQTSIDDWDVYPIDRCQDVNSSEQASPSDATLSTRYYRATCRVTQEIDRSLAGGDSENEMTVITRQISAVLQCQVSYDGPLARLVQLHETRLPERASIFASPSSQSESSLARQKNRAIIKTNVPSRHRYIAAANILEQYGAKPMLLEQSSSSRTPPTSSMPAAGKEKVTNQSDLVGISIQGWNIATSQGFMGDQTFFEEATFNLEPLAQYRGERPAKKSERKLVLPEMVFPLAHVVLEYNASANDNDQDDTQDGQFPREESQSNEEDIFLVWDAMDALQEWSHAHRRIPMPDKNVSEAMPTGLSRTSRTSSTASYRGVSVLESSDASLWKQKGRNAENTNKDQDIAARHIGSTEFHYDWTYSTPFAGNVFISGQPIQQAKGGSSLFSWKPLPKSGMPIYLLTDTSAPILYYDHILLYEDDLHDNGAVEYSVKVRVMPHVAYVLARLFVRVDHVLVRLREARWLIEFPSSKGVTAKHSAQPFEGTRIYRDVAWREAAWKDLGPIYQLPSQVQAWTTNSSTRESQAFQSLLSQLPLVDTPSDIAPHAVISYPAVARQKKSKAGVNMGILSIVLCLAVFLSLLPFETVNFPTIVAAASSSDTSSYVSVRALDKYGNAKQVSHALEAAKRQGRPVLVAVVKADASEKAIASSRVTSGEVEANRRSQSFMIAISLGTSPVLHSLQITPPGDTPSTFLAICCTGIKGDANWLIDQIQTYASTIWDRYNIPSDKIATPTIAHVVARLMGRFAGYAEKQEWSSFISLPASKNEDDNGNDSSSTWSRPMGIQTMILSTASSFAPGLLQIDPSGRILTAAAQSSSGKVSAAAIGRDSDRIQSRLLKLFEKGEDGEQSWETTPPSLEQCQEALLNIFLDETGARGKNFDQQVQVEIFSSDTGRLERKVLPLQ
jgi:20S proteasome alpha/beta subunit